MEEGPSKRANKISRLRQEIEKLRQKNLFLYTKIEEMDEWFEKSWVGINDALGLVEYSSDSEEYDSSYYSENSNSAEDSNFEDYEEEEYVPYKNTQKTKLMIPNQKKQTSSNFSPYSSSSGTSSTQSPAIKMQSYYPISQTAQAQALRILQQQKLQQQLYIKQIQQGHMLNNNNNKTEFQISQSETSGIAAKILATKFDYQINPSSRTIIKPESPNPPKKKISAMPQSYIQQTNPIHVVPNSTQVISQNKSPNTPIRQFRQMQVTNSIPITSLKPSTNIEVMDFHLLSGEMIEPPPIDLVANYKELCDFVGQKLTKGELRNKFSKLH